MHNASIDETTPSFMMPEDCSANINISNNALDETKK
jgi:hypothetical protein